ncbi:MAG: YggU family protein [Deltaproteobacteria bacterium RIFOXYA12_FULL_61_11]|nr:MAG: YggU family protein [Deltaproteobacteria bacterium RIFOXYA12_FULL_61_11]
MTDFLAPEHDGRLRLRVYLQPGASINKIVGLQGDELKIAIRSPAVENRANEELIRYLAKRLGLARSKVNLVQGQTCRHKVLRLDESNADLMRERLILPEP